MRIGRSFVLLAYLIVASIEHVQVSSGNVDYSPHHILCASASCLPLSVRTLRVVPGNKRIPHDKQKVLNNVGAASCVHSPSFDDVVRALKTMRYPENSKDLRQIVL